MDPLSTIKEIGGGLSAVVIVALALVNVMQYRRNEQLVEKLLDCSDKNSAQMREMHEKTLETVSALTAATQASNATAEAAVALLERRS